MKKTVASLAITLTVAACAVTTGATADSRYRYVKDVSQLPQHKGPPGTRGYKEVIAQIPKCARIIASDCDTFGDSGWCKFKWNGTSGWSSATNLSRDKKHCTGYKIRDGKPKK